MIQQFINFRNISINLFFFFLIIFITSLFYIFCPRTTIAGDYHIGSENLLCSDCHTMHYSMDGGVPAEWGTEGPYIYLLKNFVNEMCLMCHDGTDPSAPNVMGETRYVPSAGRFSPGDPNSQHSLGSLDEPPGYSGQWNGDPLTCVSCHNPHGNDYYRNLRPDPGGAINLTVTCETGLTYGGIAAIQQFAKTPITDHYKVDNIKYRQSESGTNYGLSAWCAGCHTDFYGTGGDVNMGGSSSGDTQISDADTWIRHPTIDITLSDGVTNEHIDGEAESGLGYWWSIQILSRPPYISPSGEIGTKAASDNETGCGSCHKAHGSDQIYGLMFDDPETSDIEDGTRMVGTCQVCHLRGKGFYETSPHGDPDSGLLRITKWAKGECLQCHSQHAGNPYNLFTDNTNSLCYTSDCHDFTPTGGYSGYPAQEEDRAPASSEYPGYFEYFFGSTRAAGLNNRVRWPGKVVFEDPNTYTSSLQAWPERFFSPHRNDSDMPRKDSDGKGLCLNCHSPHGTASTFDMLNKTYLSTKGSWENNVPENYELCLGCHGPDGPLGMDPETKRIADYYDISINPNTAGHMIRKSTKSASYWPDHIQAGDRLACSNCHNPHGSRGYDNNNKPNSELLSDQRPQWNDLIDTVSSASKCRAFCFGCHIPSDDPNCTLYSNGCPEVDGIQMVAIPVLSGANPAHESGENSRHCGNCHGKNYDTTTSASPAFNVHNPKATPRGGGMMRLKVQDLSPPTGLIATGGKRLVELVWDTYPDENIRGYNIYRSKIPGGSYTLVSSEPDNTIRYMDMDIRPEQNYYYVLTVVDIAGKESSYSKEAGATPMSLTPGQLMTLEEVKELSAKIEKNSILITWEESMDEIVAGYNIYRRKEESAESILITQEGPLKWPVYEDKDIEKDNIYIYSVVAVDEIGNEARFPKEVRVVYKELFITSVSLSQGERPLRGGQEMVVTLTGSIGGSAYFAIEGISNNIPMEEIEDTGTYTGKYIIPNEIEDTQVNITCFLGDLKGNVTFMEGPVHLRIDNLPPVPPANLEAVIHPDKGISLFWRIDDGNQDIATYRIYRSSDEEIIKGPDRLIASDLPKDVFEYQDITIMPDTRYHYIITSVDEAGNESEPSNKAEVLIPPDTIPPNIEKMQIIGDMGVWRTGDVITILMVGEPGGKAMFSIGSKIKDIVMQESPGTGNYKGQYIFQEGDESEEMQIIGRLTDPSGNPTIFKTQFRVSVVHDSGGTGPQVFGIEDNSYQISGEDSLVAGDVLDVIVTGTPNCFAVFHLGALVDEDQSIKIDWSGFRESEWPDISGYQIHKVTGPPSILDEDTILTRLGIGQRQYRLSDEEISLGESAMYLAVSDYEGHPRVISSPKWNIPLIESEESGIYKGKYSVQPGDKMIQGYIFVTLKDRSGRPSAPYHSTNTINIDTGSRIEIQPLPSELKADSLSKSLIKITLKDAKEHGVGERQVGVALFTTSEYTGLVGLGIFNHADIGYMTNPLKRMGAGIENDDPYVFTTDNFGHIEVDYEAGFAAKTIIFRARDRVTGDVGIGYCTSFIEAQAQVEQYRLLRARGQGYTFSLSANPEWLTADGISTSRIIASVASEEGEPVKGHKVVFTTIPMGDGYLLQQEAITDDMGFAEVTYRAGKRIGTVEIRATVEIKAVDSTLESKTYIILKSDAPALVSITVEPKKIPADGRSQCKLKIKVTDINGNPARGVGLALTLIKGDGKITDVDETTDYLGQAEAIYRSGTEPGIVLFNLRVTSKIPTSEELEEIRWAR